MDGLKMENPIKMDDLGENPTILGNIHMFWAVALKHFIVPC